MYLLLATLTRCCYCCCFSDGFAAVPAVCCCSGALASLPPAEAVHCVYTWEVRSGSGVLLLSPFDAPDGAPALHSAAAARLPAAPGGAREELEGALSWRGLKGQRRLQSRGLSEVYLLGVGAGEALIGLAVTCSRRGRVVASVTAPEVQPFSSDCLAGQLCRLVLPFNLFLLFRIRRLFLVHACNSLSDPFSPAYLGSSFSFRAIVVDSFLSVSHWLQRLVCLQLSMAAHRCHL